MGGRNKNIQGDISIWTTQMILTFLEFQQPIRSFKFRYLLEYVLFILLFRCFHFHVNFCQKREKRFIFPRPTSDFGFAAAFKKTQHMLCMSRIATRGLEGIRQREIKVLILIPKKHFNGVRSEAFAKITND